ncbi:Olfactory receptor 15 [Heterocephalus glaber]|nr:Olfactory receptor 15 [Heterocephalus glaber]
MWMERPLSAVVLVSYILTLVGNSSMIFLFLVEPTLQMPRYFFLNNLSLLDLCIICTIVTQLLANLWGSDKTIAAWGCITQLYVYTLAGCTEWILPAMITIDHYVAICQHLQYNLIMHPWICVQMAAASLSSGLANSLVQATLTIQLPLCGYHTLDDFCEVSLLTKLACGNTTPNDIALVVGAIPLGMMSLLMVIISYIFIAGAI